VNNTVIPPPPPPAPVNVIKSDFEWGVTTEVMRGDIAN